MTNILIFYYLVFIVSSCTFHKKHLNMNNLEKKDDSCKRDQEDNFFEENNNCLFCKFSKKICHSYIIWENQTHMAFLSIFPNTKGVTVVIPKKHLSSYIFDQDSNEILNLMLASKEVEQIILKKMPDVGRVALIFEGFGIDHLHAKLFPMHETSFAKEEWKCISSKNTKYFEKYEGYVSSHDFKDVNLKEIEKVYELFSK
jgi:histidine triad (HIT) family protein